MRLPPFRLVFCQNAQSANSLEKGSVYIPHHRGRPRQQISYALCYTGAMKDTTNSPGQKRRVGILYGGRSTEHEVSILSAKSVLAAIDTTKFEPVPIGISKSGTWHLDLDLKYLNNPALLSADSRDTDIVTLVPGASAQQLIDVADSRLQERLDVVFPVLHGPLG